MLKELLGTRTHDDLAEAVAKYMGTGTRASRISEWTKKKRASGLAQIALLHETDPRGCFEFLMGRRDECPDSARIHVDPADQAQRGLLVNPDSTRLAQALLAAARVLMLNPPQSRAELLESLREIERVIPIEEEEKKANGDQ